MAVPRITMPTHDEILKKMKANEQKQNALEEKYPNDIQKRIKERIPLQKEFRELRQQLHQTPLTSETESTKEKIVEKITKKKKEEQINNN